VPLADPGVVTVQMQPWPLPDATIQAEVFEDVSPTNSAPDVPAERGLAGFVGHIADYIGEVTTDVYGDPLCGGPGHASAGATLSMAASIKGRRTPSTQRATARLISPRRRSTAIRFTRGRHSGRRQPSRAKSRSRTWDPTATPLGRPPDGSGWIQTTTLEGNHDWDAW